MYWAAIDFETANSARSSACAVGIALFDAGERIHAESWLIRPQPFIFHPGNIAVHGIDEADVDHAPEFGELWPEIAAMIHGRTLIAHNAPFDIGVLRACFDLAGIPHPDIPYACTLSMARKAYPGLDSYRLPVVADRCGVDLESHHDAYSDAVACGEIAAYTLNHHGIESLELAADVWKLTIRNVDAAKPMAAVSR